MEVGGKQDGWRQRRLAAIGFRLTCTSVASAFGLLPPLWWWSWTLWLSLRDRFAPTSCQEAKPGTSTESQGVCRLKWMRT